MSKFSLIQVLHLFEVDRTSLLTVSNIMVKVTRLTKPPQIYTAVKCLLFILGSDTTTFLNEKDASVSGIECFRQGGTGMNIECPLPS